MMNSATFQPARPEAPFPSHRRGSGRARRGAFTLIELLVATAVMIILVGLVIQITGQVLNVWNRSSGQLSANAEARVAMDLLTQDLETAVFRNNGKRWLEAEKNTLDGPTGMSTQTTLLKLFSPALDRPEGPGDISAIAYKLDFRNPVDAGTEENQTFVLYRMIQSPQDTFDDYLGENQDALRGDGLWSTNDIIPIGKQNKEDGANYLVSNITRFVIDFYVEGEDEPVAELGSENVFYGGGTEGEDASAPTVGPGASAPLNRPLARAEIRLTVVSDEGLRILERDGLAGTGYEDVNDVIREHGKVFTRFVSFGSRPL